MKIIDLTFCSKVSNTAVIDCPTFSDHSLVTCDIVFQMKKIKTFFVVYRDFKKLNYEKFYQTL